MEQKSDDQVRELSETEMAELASISNELHLMSEEPIMSRSIQDRLASCGVVIGRILERHGRIRMPHKCVDNGILNVYPESIRERWECTK